MEEHCDSSNFSSSLPDTRLSTGDTANIDSGPSITGTAVTSSPEKASAFSFKSTHFVEHLQAPAYPAVLQNNHTLSVASENCVSAVVAIANMHTTEPQQPRQRFY